MEFLSSWLLVLIADLCIWIACSRVPQLRLALIDKINIRRTKGRKANTLCQMIEYNLKKSHTALLEADDEDQSGFAPPRITRALISILIAIQNLIALGYASRADEPIREVVLCSGKLALANLFPLFLFGSHEIILVKVLRHSRQQVLWAHNLFAWIVLLESVIHVGLSLFLTSGLTSWNRLIGWIMGLTTSVALCVSLNLSLSMETRVRRTFHGVVGIVGILSGTIHLLQSTACLLLGLGIIGIGATGIHGLWRPGSTENASLKGIAKQYVELKVRVPDNKHDFYIKSCGTFYRAAWVTGQDSSQCEATVLLPPSVIEGSSERGTTREEVKVTCNGLFRAPLPPYTYLAKELDIIATGSGIFEGYSCFRWRQRLLESKDNTCFKTRLIWFTTRSCILSPFFGNLGNDMSSWKAGYVVVVVILVNDKNPVDDENPVDDNGLPPLLTGKLTTEHDRKNTCMRSAISQHLEKNPLGRQEYFVGENLRSLLRN